ncbi:MAG TPA: pitrilysin family protein [Caulobacteraceae bacterium]|jgi:zinc protease
MRSRTGLAWILAGAVSLTALGTAVAAQPARPASAGAQPASIAVPPIDFTQRTLANGMKVYAIRDPRTSGVTVQMWYDVGGKDDPQNRTGFAHLFEHILSRVTINMAPGQISRMVEDAGGARNASTWTDFTNYFEIVPANQLEAMIWTHAERMGRSVLDESVFNAERDIVKEELRLRVLSPPYGRLAYTLPYVHSFETHPYKRPVIGSIEDLDAAKLEDARAFHENFYRPDNATLIVAGNFDPARLNAYVDKHLAPIARPSKPIRRYNMVERPRTTARSITEYAPNVPLPAVFFSWPTVKVAHPDTPALMVLDAILSGGRSSRLYQSLVYDTQLAQSASSSLDNHEDAGFFSATATLAAGKKVEDAEAALAAEIARVRDAPVSAEELAEAKTGFLSNALFERETAQGKAFALGQSLVSTGDPRWGDKNLAAVSRVTAADVQRVARKYLRDDVRLSMRYLDESARPGQQASTTAAPKGTAIGMTYPPATRAPNQPAADAQRQAPPPPSVAPVTATPTFAERRLPNGLRVVVAKSTDVPVVNFNMVFSGGAAADPAQRPGLASLTANLVDEGTRTMSATQLAASTEALGASLGASAGPDSSTLFMDAPTANAEAAGRLMAEVAMAPAFAPDELERQRRRVLDSLAVNMRNPGFVGSQTVARVLYGGAPYGAPVIGTEASLSAMTRDEIAGYHRRWWRPDNATLVITGSLAPEAGFALAERLFGSWRAPAEPLPPGLTGRAGAAPAPRVVVVDMPAAGQAAVTVAMRAIERKDPDYYPLLVANSVLGGSSTARLFQEVRVKRALSYGANSGLVARREEGFLTASAQTKHETADEVADVILAEITRLAREPVDAETIGKRQTFITGNTARQVETTGGLGGFLANLVAQDVPLEEFNRFAGNVRGVTAQQIGTSVASELDPRQASIVIVGDAKAFLPALREKHPNVEVIPFDQLDLGSATLRKGG